MSKEKCRQFYEAFASGVAFVAVEDAEKTQSIGSAFHVGDGVFVTARHVVENKKIISIETTERTLRPNPDGKGAHEVLHNPSRGKVVRGPFFHPEEHIDVAALVVEGIDAPVIPLGGHLDDWLGTELVLCPVLVLGYQNRAIEAAAVIEELIKIAKDMRDADQRGKDLGLTEEERAFCDALADNESAVQAMGSKELRVIATELVTQVRKSVTIDWTVRESARAKIKVMVKRILKRHGYPPDLQEEAVKTVLAQAELLCADWAA